MKHIDLLKRCHDFMRGAVIHTPSGVLTPAADELAKEINDYLNEQRTHSPRCWAWGSDHYECACNHIKQLEKQLAELND
jgi:hypothetical protein